MNRLVVIGIASLFAVEVNAGILKGNIVDKNTKEPLIGASVQIVGTTQGTITDFDGNFELNVPDGVVDIEARYVSYKSRLLRHIKVEGEIISNIELEEAAQALSAVEVVARRNRESENMLLLEQKTAVLATQAVGAKELSRKGVGDAEGAVQKVSGISKQDGVKNVFVRGLGDRYNTTLLNGFPIPSEDPEYKNIALSFFETDMIQSIGVNKVFAASQAGDVAGAAIDIRSKELMGDEEFDVKGSFGVNTQTVAQPFLLQDGSNYMGIASKQQPGNDLSLYNFSNRLTPSVIGFNPNHSYGVSGGKKFLVGDNADPLSFFLLANYSQQNTFTDELVRNTNTGGDTIQEQNGSKYVRTTTQMLLANVNYAWKKKHNLSYNFMMIHANNQYVVDYEGMNARFEDYHYQGFLRRQQTNDNLLIVNQLHTDWQLAPSWKLNVAAAYNYVVGDEPDRRINYLSETDQIGSYTPTRGTGSQQRYFSTLQEHDANVKAEAVYSIPDNFGKKSNVRIGYSGRFVVDGFEAVEYDMSAIRTADMQLDQLDLDAYFNQEGLNNGNFLLDKNTDIYTVNKLINAVYADATYQFTKAFTANLGFRMNHVLMRVDYNVNRGGTQGSEEINKPFFLPSLNLKYDLTKKHSLRLGASKTYTLPQAKEISPFRYVGVSFKSQGNQNLQPSDNYNVDLKWDFFPTESELVSIGSFFKYIANPISRIEVASAGGYLSYENISDKALVGGVEIELRKDLYKKSIGEDYHKLNLGFNGTYTYTHAKVEQATDKTGSQLEGASPFIVNADLSYQFRRKDYGFTGTIVCNYFSDRVYTIGTQGFDDIIEKGVSTLDVVMSAQLTQHFTVDMKMKNLINPSYRLVRDVRSTGQEVVLNEYDKGREISVGLTYKF